MKTSITPIISGLFCLLSSTISAQADYVFSASAGTFTEITGGTNVSKIEADDEVSNGISLGFNFEFGGVTYNHVAASSNGFMYLDTNNTASRTGNNLDGVAQAIIAPLWDDLDGRATNSTASYTITGTAPNQIFTFEWLKWEWNYTSGNEVISFQVKLYEGSNKIEFIYRPESANPTNPTASIGLCGTQTGSGSFLSLNGTGASPSASSTFETTTLSSTPDSGRTYVFTEPTCKSPDNLRDSLTTANADVILFDSKAGSGKTVLYEYGSLGFTQGSGTSGSDTTHSRGGKITLTGLNGATSYDIYVRVICTANDTSKATKFSFSTTYPNPQKIDFTGFTGANLSTLHSGWSEARGKPSPSGTTSAWTNSNATQTTALGKPTARINLYTNTREEWLLSPKINIKTTDSLQFSAAMTDWNNGGQGSVGADDSLKIMISIDGGNSWDLIDAFTAASSLSNSLSEHKYSLSSYAGSASIIGFLAQDGPIDNADDFDYHISDIFIGTKPQKDISVIDVLEPIDGACGSDSMKFKVVIKNNGLANQSNFPVYVRTTGSANTTLTHSVPLSKAGETDTITIGSINTRTGGAYTIWAFSGLNQDENPLDDTLKLNPISINSIPPTPTIPASVSICNGNDTTIVASNLGTGQRWYRASLGDSIISRDTSFTVTGLNSKDTLYVETFSLFGGTVGAANNSIGNGGTYTSFTDGLVFNVTKTVTIDSVTVYPGSGGNVVVRLLNASNTVLQTKTVSVFGVTTGETIPVGFTINPGNGYKLDASGSSVSNFYRNSSGAVYPYRSSNNSIQITQTINNLAGYYYFFYNWQLRSEGCPSSRAMTILDTLPSPQFNLGPDTTFCKGAVNYTLNATTNNASYLWQNNSTAATYTATNQGKYWCKVTDQTGCSASDTMEINAFPAPVINFPNVVNQCTNSDTLRLRFATPIGGVYGGTGVTNGILDPTKGQIGRNLITYAYTDQYNCVTVDTAFYDLFQAPSVTFTGSISSCENDSSFELTGGSPAGGTYAGNAITNNIFNPLRSSVGTQNFTYRYQDMNGCADSANGSLTVNAKPNAQLSVLGYWCINAGAKTLTEGTPSGGTYFGPFVSGSNFNADSAGLGTHTIQYTITDNNNCKDTVSNNIAIEDFPKFDIIGDSIGCGQDEAPELEVTLSGMNYSWINGATTQKATIKQNGAISVTVIDPNTQAGCSNTKSKTVNYEAVCASIDENFAAKFSIYPNPANSVVSINWTSSKVSRINLYNANGQLVISKVITEKTNSHILQIEELSPGTYVLEITTNQEVLKKQLIIQ